MSVHPSVRPLCFAYGQERLEIGSGNSARRTSMKIKRTHIFVISIGLVVAKLCPAFLTYNGIKIKFIMNNSVNKNIIKAPNGILMIFII